MWGAVWIDYIYIVFVLKKKKKKIKTDFWNFM